MLQQKHLCALHTLQTYENIFMICKNTFAAKRPVKLPLQILFLLLFCSQNKCFVVVEIIYANDRKIPLCEREKNDGKIVYFYLENGNFWHVIPFKYANLSLIFRKVNIPFTCPSEES